MPSENPASGDRLPAVVLFTDGACSGNPGPGGWAFILRHPQSGKEIQDAGAEPLTTNNRMELLAAIRGLEALRRRSRVELVTDSQYVGLGIRDWLPGWKKNGWRRGRGRRAEPVKNVDLWQRLDELLARHAVKIKLVRGHAGHAENEACDRLAVAAYQQFL